MAFGRLSVVLIATAVLAAQAGPAAAQADAPASFQSDFCKGAAATRSDWQALKTRVVDPALSFGIDLYKAAAGQTGNLAFSPASVDSALAMTLAGAGGTTAHELAAALHVPSHGDDWHELNRHLLGMLTCPQAHRVSLLTMANALFVQQGKALKAPFVALLRTDYDAPLTAVDFRGHADAARQTINGWTAKATAGKIDALIAPHVLTAATRLIIVDAVYLKSRWAVLFPKDATQPGAFHTSAAQVVTAPMMHREGGAFDFEYAQIPAGSAVGMPSSDHAMTVVLLVPDAPDGLAALEAALSPALITQAVEGLRHRKVTLTMPKFKFAASLSLKEMLMGLGVKRLFDVAHADLTPIDGGASQLYVGDVLHKATIDVNEEGLEAAAATAVVFMAGAGMPPPQPPVVVKADHPFLYLVLDTSTKSLLFMGRVTNPTLSGG